MALPLALPLALIAAGSLAKAGSELFAGRKAEKFRKKQEAQQERLLRKREREQRRQALARVIGLKTPLGHPQPSEAPVKAPGFTTENIIGALGQLAATLGPQFVGLGKSAPPPASSPQLQQLGGAGRKLQFPRTIPLTQR